MDIFLVRHTRVQIQEGTCYGQTDVALADSFDEEFTQLQTKLPALDDKTLIISSPLQRCLQLSARLSYRLQTDPRIIDLNYGAWEMKSWSEIATDDFQRWATDFVSFAPPQGESYQMLANRCEDFWHDLIQRDAERAIIITHSGVIRCLIAKILEIPLHKVMSLNLDCGSVTQVTYTHDWASVDYLNR